MTGEFVGSGNECQLEREQTQAALRRASNELVDRTVMTPWERRRAEVILESEDDNV